MKQKKCKCPKCFSVLSKPVTRDFKYHKCLKCHKIYNAHLKRFKKVMTKV